MGKTKRHIPADADLWYGCNETGRDKKPANKPNSTFKKLRRKSRRAKARQALRKGQEPIEEKKNDIWDWN